MCPWQAAGSALSLAGALTSCQPQQHSSCKCSKAFKQRLICSTQNQHKMSLDAFSFIVLTPATFFSFPSFSLFLHLVATPLSYLCGSHPLQHSYSFAIIAPEDSQSYLGSPWVFLRDTASAACSETHCFVPSSVAVSCTAMSRHH